VVSVYVNYVRFYSPSKFPRFVIYLGIVSEIDDIQINGGFGPCEVVISIGVFIPVTVNL